MLERYYVRPRCRARLMHGPLADHLEEVARIAHKARYSVGRAQLLINSVARLSRFAEEIGAGSADKVHEDIIQRFRSQLLSAYQRESLDVAVRILRKAGIVPPLPVPECDPLLDRYEKTLREVRGVAPSTCRQYLKVAAELLAWWDKSFAGCPLRDLQGHHVLAYLNERLDSKKSASSKGSLCGQTRIFLRFLYAENAIDVDLAPVVPKIRTWKLANVPHHLPWPDVIKLLDSVDVSTPDGLRDKAILLLVARMGLRSSEVCALKLGDIDWRHGVLTVAKTKTRRQRALPIPHDVAPILGKYILRVRPKSDDEHVFLRLRAPVKRFKNSSSIMRIVEKRLRDAAIRGPTRGPHMLRHSLATHLINSGVSVKQIADILGHADLQSTAIYAKVDTNHLGRVALPFPGSSL